MGSSREGGGDGGAGSSSSDDLLALLQRLRDSVSGLAEEFSGSNGVPGVADATAVNPVQLLKEQNTSIIFVEPSTDVSETDASEDVSPYSADLLANFDNCAADNEEDPSDNFGESAALELQELAIASSVVNPLGHTENESADSRLGVLSEEIPVEVGESDTESSGVITVSNGKVPAAEPESSKDLWESWEAMDSQPERPERYANPTRTIPLGREARDRQRVVSNSNLVGAPPPQALVRGGRFQQRPGGRIKDLLKDPVVAVVVLSVLLGIVIVVASAPFVFSGSNELQRAVPLPSASLVQGVAVAPEETRLPPSQAVTVEEVSVKASSTESGENGVPKEQAVEEGKRQEEGFLSILPEIEASEYRWTIEIAAVTKQSDYERLMIQLQKDGFHPLVRVENLPNGVDVFRLEIRESEMSEALVRMSQLKRLKYIDLKHLVMKPANESKKR